MAIRQLKGSSAGGPKRLKTIVVVSYVWKGDDFEPKLVVEETVV